MTSDPSLSPRVTRLGNDTESLYELVTDIRSTQDAHTRRFDTVDATLAAYAARFDSIDTTLAEVLRRLPEPT